MDVQSVVKQYRATEDNDLKYMALKEELSPLDVCENLQNYVDQLLIPILMEEANAEIVNLVSLQVFPYAVELCLINDKSGPWFDDIVVNPLIEKMVSARTTIAIQTLKTVSRKICERRIRLGTRPQLIEEFLQKCDDTVLSVEALYYLIQCYYDMHRGVPPPIIDQILKLARSGPQDDTTRLLIRESLSRANLDAILQVKTQLNLQELEFASECWWRFAPIFIDIFHLQLLPSLSNHETRASALRTLLNFQPFYTIKRLDDDTLLGRNNEKLLIQSLQEIDQELSRTAPETPDKNHEQEADSDSDSDPEQTAYLAELPSDEEIEFENEVEGPAEPLPRETNIRNICQEILTKLKANFDSSPLSSTYEPLPSILNKLFKREEEDLLSLSQLQAALETLSQLASVRPTPNLPWSQICQDLVLPRIVLDKTFVQKLKAGNLTQSIDEGATLRASAQSTLQQLLPLIDFKTICIMLEYELKNGIQDKDSGVKQLAAELVHSLLSTHYSEIIGLQWQWYAALLKEEEDPRDLAAQALRTSLREDYPAVG
ncbi:hypothetical protein ZYGR_0Z00390 [Zygosaccharomyces rouxii]|uniref:ZYRO0G01034p n=2 Tax=Zygosaccharomyces rouxii TaxID=4956 RepID=C5E1S5_ZYGRC|nr:uncharacterized protein ZYRO0G01034g [Zygosaccharomyces rouxii]KAH9202116.1 hypothetical protein LQ764DRAFT_207117 [Zygosaccharomyces rouxii]GAV50616.1 hypothetical protein ZYGR_0Z00390 [Zygosaccharomyces rouxii]CAR29118.1 ZYRO0G01034p [Zygosaccharomyces rouxii]